MTRVDGGASSTQLVVFGFILGVMGVVAVTLGVLILIDDRAETSTVKTVNPSIVAQEAPAVTTSVVSSGADATSAAERVTTTADPDGGAPGVVPGGQPTSCPPSTKAVSTAEQLRQALATAGPGDSIVLGDGVYAGNFVASTSGTEASPIFLCGSAGAVLDAGGATEGYVLHLDGVQYWRVVGFTVRNGQKGVMADATTNSVIQGLTVEDIGDEAIHLRAFSSFNSVLNNTVRRTGLRRDKFGEGIYVGSAESNWATYSDGQADRSDFNLVQGNTISATSSEAIDIKEGTTGGRLIGNVLDGTGMTAADSLVDVKGNEWVIEGNVGSHAPSEGMQTHRILDGWGSRNTFRGNTIDVDGDGLHFYIHDPDDTANVVSCDNRTASGDSVRSNVDCVPN